MNRARNVAVYVYEQVDLLDVAGPFDVFATSSNWGQDFRVYTVGERKDPVHTVSRMTIVPQYDFGDCPAPDILIVPGGLGSRTEMHHTSVTGWIQAAAQKAEMVISVCTGALLLAKAGVLQGLRVTTNRRALDILREALPSDAELIEDVRYVDNGKIILSAGVTAGFDAALHAVARLYGEERAVDTASRLEYRWSESLDIRRAEAEDVLAVQRLYHGAAKWIRDAKGIDQWQEASFTESYLEQFIREHDVFVAYRNGELVGCFSIQWGYEEIWGDQYHDNAGHVHRLTVSRPYKGQGIGSRMLAWAKAYINGKGKEWIRLDCMADNPALNQYYRGLGFVYRGRFDGRWSVNLYEQPAQ
ncbi:GNAT family N-acetyltransferase [Paenibacillus silvisoli]|uniref:GNAT family N-acetyltransferase n=1 Tax=Paenibacillus silvisoli TaxID=3110539 RepID=UPI0028052199|nr:GNAT family N-acetyltransferase [Paenibacillus silvisoli]